MGNNQKNKRIYQNVVEGLDSISRGSHPENLEKDMDRLNCTFTGGFRPENFSGSDFSQEILGDIYRYSELMNGRKKIIIAEGEREITSEVEALESLGLAEKIARRLILPHFHETSQFSNKIFKDISNLSLAYVHAIVSGVGDEYIGKRDAFEAKHRAIDLAKNGIRVRDRYLSEEGKCIPDLRELMVNFRGALGFKMEDFMRAFENVPTTQKKIYKGRELMAELSDRISGREGEIIFRPEVICPIAHGGTELGVRIANAYEDKGHDPLVYPLLYSVKTRKHRYPWVQHDAEFLNEGNLEGKDILVTDDWVTTGRTLVGILGALQKYSPHELRVATIKRDREKSNDPVLDDYNIEVGAEAIYSGGKE